MGIGVAMQCGHVGDIGKQCCTQVRGQARHALIAPGKSVTMANARRSLAKSYVLVGAGDIAGCSSLAGAAATAKLIEQIPGTVFAAGDLAYDRGTVEEFSKCYDTTWGKFKDRTRPTPGNHEYNSPGGLAYFAYWGERAGPRGKGYYSYDLGKWHVVALNTNCDAPGVGGCGAGSEQEKWLKRDLAEHAYVMHCGVRTSRAFQQRTIQAACVASGVARFLEGFVRSSCGLNAGGARTFL